MAERKSWLGLEGRVCVITGAGSGIGAETARQLAAEGASVAVLDRYGDPARQVADEITREGGRAIAVEADVAQPASVAAAAAQVLKELGHCRVLINNAAVRQKGRLADIDLEDWSRLHSVNLTGTLICTQAFVPQMVASGPGGSLIHVASLIGHNPQIGSGAYSVSKAGMLMMSRVLALELAEQGIRSNTVSPGFTRTPPNEASYKDVETFAKRQAMVPSGRIAGPADMANVIAFLASDRSSYVNAEDILVDGGVDKTLMNTVPKAGLNQT